MNEANEFDTVTCEVCRRRLDSISINGVIQICTCHTCFMNKSKQADADNINQMLKDNPLHYKKCKALFSRYMKEYRRMHV